MRNMDLPTLFDSVTVSILLAVVANAQINGALGALMCNRVSKMRRTLKK